MVVSHPTTGMAVITTATSRTVVPRARSLGATAAAAAGRLQSIRGAARSAGGRAIGGRFAVVVGGGQGAGMVAEGAVVQSVHQYRRALQRPEGAAARRVDARA